MAIAMAVTPPDVPLPPDGVTAGKAHVIQNWPQTGSREPRPPRPHTRTHAHTAEALPTAPTAPPAQQDALATGTRRPPHPAPVGGCREQAYEAA